MSNLLETYENMVDASQAHAEEEAFNKEAEAIEAERVETLTKYATAADNLLAEEFGDDYAESDVVELAHKMIDHDISQEQSQEKVAEYVDAGTVMARAFINELNSSNQ